jgi:hypothetical protein
VALVVGILGLVGTGAYWVMAPKKESATASTRPVMTPVFGGDMRGFAISGRF